MIDDPDNPRTEEARRLVEARIARGFDDAKAAATYFGWNYDTYIQHERGTRGIKKAVERYATAYRASAAWLLTGEGSRLKRVVNVVGYAGAGGDQVYFGDGQGPFEEVDAPPDATEKTVAIRIRGTSLGAHFDGGLVFYNRREDPPTMDLAGRICVVGLGDGRVMVKRLEKGQLPKRFTLRSNEPPIYDAEVQWAAPVIHVELPKG